MLDQALSLASSPSNVTVLTVIEVGTHDEERDTPASLIEEVYWSRSAHLSRICNPVGIPEDRRRILVGRAATEIVAFGNSHGSDLVVLGEHGGGMRRRLLGSTAFEVVNLLDCNVLVVRTEGLRQGVG